MILTPETIKQTLRGLGVGADKWLGQHFLIDATVLGAMSDTAASLRRSDTTLVEIGPGLGVLTSELLALGNPLIAIEKDPVLAQALPRMVVPHDAFTVLTGDALQLLTADERFSALTDWLVVANIPYAITSPLLRQLVYHTNPPREIVVLVQKEAAERICAAPGSSKRGFLSVMLQLRTTCEIIQHVPRTAFWPQPRVESAILRLTRRETAYAIDDMTWFVQVLTYGFASKRKKLSNTLAAGLRCLPADITHALAKKGIDSNRRAETLTIEEWIMVSEVFKR